ncbi:MAG TPA: hypothetical protein VH590_05135, partial [Ktedonobacterales bacterium]
LGGGVRVLVLRVSVDDGPGAVAWLCVVLSESGGSSVDESSDWRRFIFVQYEDELSYVTMMA